MQSRAKSGICDCKMCKFCLKICYNSGDIEFFFWGVVFIGAPRSFAAEFVASQYEGRNADALDYARDQYSCNWVKLFRSVQFSSCCEQGLTLQRVHCLVWWNSRPVYIAVDIIQTLEIGVGLPQYYCQIGYQATRVETVLYNVSLRPWLNAHVTMTLGSHGTDLVSWCMRDSLRDNSARPGECYCVRWMYSKKRFNDVVVWA